MCTAYQIFREDVYFFLEFRNDTVKTIEHRADKWSSKARAIATNAKRVKTSLKYNQARVESPVKRRPVSNNLLETDDIHNPIAPLAKNNTLKKLLTLKQPLSEAEYTQAYAELLVSERKIQFENSTDFNVQQSAPDLGQHVSHSDLRLVSLGIMKGEVDLAYHHLRAFIVAFLDAYKAQRSHLNSEGRENEEVQVGGVAQRTHIFVQRLIGPLRQSFTKAKNVVEPRLALQAGEQDDSDNDSMDIEVIDLTR